MGRVLVTRRLPDGGLDPLARSRARRPEAGRHAVHPRRAARARGRGRRDRVAAHRPHRRRRARRRGGRAAARRRATSRSATTTSTSRPRREHGIVGVQHAGRARRDDGRPRVPADARPRRASRPTAEARPARRRVARVGRSRSTSAGTCTARCSASSASGASAARWPRERTGFGMRVHPPRAPRHRRSPGYVADLDALLATADFVSLHVPGGDATRHLIDARRLALMKPTAVLVNTARGTVVDEAALADALHDGPAVRGRARRVRTRARGAPAAARRAAHVLLPHIGSASPATRTAHGAAGDVGGRDRARGRHPAQRGVTPYAAGDRAGVEAEELDRGLARTQRVEQRRFLRGAGPARGEHARRSRRRGRRSHRRGRRRPSRPSCHVDVADRAPCRRPHPATSFVAPGRAITAREHREAERSNASTSRTPPSITRPAMPRACAAVVSTSPQ